MDRHCYKNESDHFSFINWKVWQNNNLISTNLAQFDQTPHYAVLYESESSRNASQHNLNNTSTYAANDQITVEVDYEWNTKSTSRDYSVIVYSK